MLMKVRFVQDYLTYEKGLELDGISIHNAERLIGLGICKEIKPRKSIKETILTK
jgi:hypothetical protein